MTKRKGAAPQTAGSRYTTRRYPGLQGKVVDYVSHFRFNFRCRSSRPAAKKAGVRIEDGQRFGLHNLRHSLSNWLVNKAKIEPKTVQGILRHANVQTTLDLYTQENGNEALAAQREYLMALGVATNTVQ